MTGLAAQVRTWLGEDDCSQLWTSGLGDQM